jgi:hypothetical protein
VVVICGDRHVRHGERIGGENTAVLQRSTIVFGTLSHALNGNVDDEWERQKQITEDPSQTYTNHEPVNNGERLHVTRPLA